MNNLVSDTISDTRLNEFFGFTQAEVDQLLLDTGLDSHRGEIREWYDGYRFGRFACASLMPSETALKIPNREILGIFRKSVVAWFLTPVMRWN